MTTNIRFKKLSETLYRVYDADKIVGVIRKTDPTTWAAQIKGRVVGHSDTRVGAARLLVTA